MNRILENCYGYIYLVTDLVTNMRYIGQHKGSRFDPKYKPSGVIIRRVMKKYGQGRFKIRPIDCAYSKAELNELERAWIADVGCTWSKGYNITPGGEGGDYFTNNPNKEETRKKMVAIGNMCKEKGIGFNNEKLRKPAHKKSIETQRKNKSGFFSLKDGMRFKNKHHTEEHKKYIGSIVSKAQSGKGNSQYGKKWIYNPGLKKSIKVTESDFMSYLSKGWMPGRRMKF